MPGHYYYYYYYWRPLVEKPPTGASLGSGLAWSFSADPKKGMRRAGCWCVAVLRTQTIFLPSTKSLWSHGNVCERADWWCVPEARWRVEEECFAEAIRER
jgi:hypothetical protein